MDRRDFLKVVGASAAGALAARTGHAAPGADAPNLLVIHTDEHNFRTLGCYRGTLSRQQAFMWGEGNVVETPNIDWLARGGALFTSFYATTPVCSPSRAAFLSGRYPQNTPVVTNNIPLDDDVVTFAEVLRRRGYATGYAGKWHLDGNGKPQWGPERRFGFEDNRFMFNRGHWKQFEETADGPRVKARKGGKPTYDVGGADEKSFATDWLADKAVAFIAANRRKPFCYMLSLPDPHGPDTVRPPYNGMFERMDFKAPRTHGKEAAKAPSWAKPAGKAPYGQSSYYGMVRCIDDNVGKILAALKRHGLIDKTIVVFTADHGDLRGEHGRHNKGVPLEGSAKVPFVVRWPAKVKAGAVVDEAFGCVDFLPTMLALMGVPAAAARVGRHEGRDGSAFLTTGKAPSGWKDVAFMRGTGGGAAGWLAAVTSRYKLVVSPADPPWLIDLERDPDELKNFCFEPECRETVRELARELIAYGERHNDERARSPKIKADLEWAATGTGEYVAPPAPAAKTGKGKRKGRRKKKAEE
ncbi:MAG: sulfatase family protein [Planctomycetota bacterium]|jgi:arylsulfatase A-like enzyme